MGRLFLARLGDRCYECRQCGTDLAPTDGIVSKAFHGKHGQAYLFQECRNVTLGPLEDRHLLTGAHTVADVLCACCNRTLGWTYAAAAEASQAYKVGKYILERPLIRKRKGGSGGGSGAAAAASSDDDDEAAEGSEGGEDDDDSDAP